MAKKKEQNPFDQRSNGKGSNEKPKFSLSSFKALPIEKQIETAKEQVNSEDGFAHPYILDVYNKYVVGDTSSTGKSKNYTKAQKPSETVNVQKGQNQNEIKDLSQLANFTGDFPESAPTIEDSKIPKKKKEVLDKENSIKADKEKALKKAQNLKGDKGKEEMKQVLDNSISDQENTIIEEIDTKIDATIKVDETVTPEEIQQVKIIEGNTAQLPQEKELADAEILEKINQLELKKTKKEEEIAKFELANQKLSGNNKGDKKDKIVISANNIEEQLDQAKNAIDNFADSNTDKIQLEKEEEALKNLISREELIKEQYYSLKEELENLKNNRSSSEDIKKVEEEFNESKKILDEFYLELDSQITMVDELRAKVNGINVKVDNNEEELKPINLDDDDLAKPFSLESIENQNEKVLSSIENNQKKGFIEWVKGKSESVKNALNKGLDYWNNLDNTKNGKITKTMIGAGLIGASIFGIGEFSGLNNPTNNVNKIWIRSVMAGLMSGLMTHNTTQKAINNIKEGWQNSSKTTKALTVLAGVGAGAGIAVSFLGTSTLIITGAAIASKLGLNKYVFDKKIDKINFDINALVDGLDDIEKQRAELNDKLRKIKMYKNLTNGAISIASGLGVMIANQVEFKLRGDSTGSIKTEAVEQETPENKEEVTEVTKTNSEKGETKSWWSRQIDKIKSITKSDDKNENMVKMSKDLDRDMISRSYTKDIPENGNTGTNEPATNSENTPNEDAKAKEENANMVKMSNDLNKDMMFQPNSKDIKITQNGNIESTEPATNPENNPTEGNQNTEGAKNEPTNQDQKEPNQGKPVKNTSGKAEVNKVNIKTIKPESIIDSQKNVGETYVYRSLIRADNELAEKLAKYQGLNLDKVNDDDYMANYLKKLATKLGRIDIGYNKEAVDNISLKLDIDKDGKLISYEIDKNTGEIKDVHHEGDQIEKDLESYEEKNLKKTYSKIQEAYDKNEGLVKPEKVVSTEAEVLPNNLNGDDSSSYLENNYNNNEITKPEEVVDTNDDIVAPEKITKTYNLENIKDYKDWDKIKGLSLRTFLERTQYSDIYGQEGKELMINLKAMNIEALKFIENDEEFNRFLLANPKLTVDKSIELYQGIIDAQEFTDELKEKYYFHDWKNDMVRNMRLTEKEIKDLKGFKDIIKGDDELKKLFKLNYGKKIFDNEKDFINNQEVRGIYNEYNKNLKFLDNKLTGDLNQIMKNNTVNSYLDKNDNALTDYLTKVREKLGESAKPQWNLGAGEKIGDYFKRITALARLKGIDINPKSILEEGKENSIYEQYQNDVGNNKIGGSKNSFKENIGNQINNNGSFDDLYQK